MANNDNAEDQDRDNEGDEDLDLGDDENEDEEDDDADDSDNGDDDKGKDKSKKKDDGDRPKETPEQKRARLQRQLAQLDKKHPPKKDADDKPKPKKEASGPNYAEEAFLIASGLTEDAEQELARTVAKDTGKTLKEVVKLKYFQSELKDLRDAKAAEDAMPKGKRGNQSRTGEVEHWLEKGGLPPDTAENKELRRKIVAARSQRDSGKSSHFAENSVVGG